MNDEELKEKLLSVFGIGPWSVNMFEIFCIGNLNVFSSKDAGLRLAMNNLKMIKPNSAWELYDEYAEKVIKQTHISLVNFSKDKEGTNVFRNFARDKIEFESMKSQAELLL